MLTRYSHHYIENKVHFQIFHYLSYASARSHQNMLPSTQLQTKNNKYSRLNTQTKILIEHKKRWETSLAQFFSKTCTSSTLGIGCKKQNKEDGNTDMLLAKILMPCYQNSPLTRYNSYFYLTLPLNTHITSPSPFIPINEKASK